VSVLYLNKKETLLESD